MSDNRLSGNLLGVQINGEYISCETSCEFNFEADMKGASPVDAGRWKEVIPAVRSWNVTVNAGLLIQAAGASAGTVLSAYLTGEEVIIRFAVKDTLMPAFILEGKAYVNSGTISASVNSKASWNCSFTGSGPFTADIAGMTVQVLATDTTGDDIVEDGNGDLLRIYQNVLGADIQTITVPELDTEGLTSESLIPHSLPNGTLKKVRVSALAAFLNSGSATMLSSLTDVAIVTPVNGQGLVFNGEKWVNRSIVTDLSNYYTKPESDSRYMPIGTDINPPGYHPTLWDEAYSWGNHAGRYPLYNGTGAYGTWAISITGNAATADLATRAYNADFADLAQRAYNADYAQDSDKWDGYQFADYLDQPVKVNSDVRHRSLSSPAYVSGFTGSGFKIEADGSATFDNLTVRKAFNVYELIVNKISGTNGALAVTDTIKMTSVVVDTNGDYYCNIDSAGFTIPVPFVIGDLLRCQMWSGRSVKYYVRRVIKVESEAFTLSQTAEGGSSIPEYGDTVARFGHISNTNRQGLLYLTSSDSNSPYLDVLDGINSASLAGKTKVRLGRLDGIVDPAFGALTGYGLYGQNVYLTGAINVTGGNAQTIAGSQAQVDALEVGGRNYYKKTTPLDSFQMGALSHDDVNGYPSAGGSPDGFYSTGISGGTGNVRLIDVITGNGEWTISGEMISNSAGWYPYFDICDQGGVYKPLDGPDVWTRFIHTVNVTNWSSDVYNFVDFTGMPYVYFNVRKLKIEKGNKATDWTPAPEDVTGYADSVLVSAQNYAAGQGYTAGRMLYTDPEFLLGYNGIAVYNNSGDSSVVLNRTALSGSPNSSGYVLYLQPSASALPNYGGFYFATQTRPNAVFKVRFVIAGNIGQTINFNSNAYGDQGTFQWNTSNVFTGGWQEFIGTIKCGSTGSFSSTAFFYIGGVLDNLYIASATVYDMTSTIDSLTYTDQAQQDAEAYAYAQAQGIATTYSLSQLKSLAYLDTVETAKLGTTVIQGGYLKNTLIDTVYLKASVINVGYIEGLAANFYQGTIGGIILSNNSIYSSNNNFSVTSAGVLTAKSGTIGGISINNNSIASSNGAFSVTNTGVLTATDANISGYINATSGIIGGFSISSGYMQGTNGDTIGGRFALNPSGGYIAFINDTTGSFSGIGSNVVSAAAGVKVLARFSNVESGSVNIGMLANAQNARTNIAIDIPNGNLRMGGSLGYNGFVTGYGGVVLTVRNGIIISP